jgi:hypothetical protein
MAKPNYKHQKRQKELARKTRQDEKLQKRTVRPEAGDEVAQDPAHNPAQNSDTVTATGATPGPATT